MDKAIEVGDGCTYAIGSDRYAATVIDVEYSISGRTITVTVQDDTAKRTDQNGMSESQTYQCTPNPNGRITIFRSLDGKPWRSQGHRARVGFGHRSPYYDFSF